MLYEHVVTWEPKIEATKDFTEHRKTFLPRTAWSQDCRSWFKQGMPEDDIMMWPGSRLVSLSVLVGDRTRQSLREVATAILRDTCQTQIRGLQCY